MTVERVAHAVGRVEVCGHQVRADAEEVAVRGFEDDMDAVEKAFDRNWIGCEGEAGAGVYGGRVWQGLGSGVAGEAASCGRDGVVTGM